MVYYAIWRQITMNWPIVGWGLIVTILFWAGIALLILRLTRRENRDYNGKHKAMDIARERYAKGEITKEAFENVTCP